MAISAGRCSGPVLRSLSPSPSPSRSYSNTCYRASSTSPSSAASGFSSRSAAFFHRSNSSASSVSQVAHRQGGRSAVAAAGQKRTCMCSPSTHPGSFRCSLHKNKSGVQHSNHSSVAPYKSNSLNARRSAMTNSLVRIGTVEGEMVKRALAALIRPSSHSQRRRLAFQPTPSRLSTMSKAVSV